MIDAVLLAAALHAAPKPPAPGTPRYVWCVAFRMEPRIWGDYRPYMREWCRGVR